MTPRSNSSGDENRYCGARKKQQSPDGDGQETCRRPAGWGTDHVGDGRCKLHGGSTRNGKRAAMTERVHKARDTFGLPVEIDPTEALLQEVYRTQGHVMWLGLQVQQLRKGDVAWGITKLKHGGDDHGTTYEAKVNAFVSLYQAERKHLVAVTKAAIDAGVEEKRLSLEQHRAELVVEMLGSIFDNLDLTPEQGAKLDELVPRALTAIAAVNS